ncbi:glycerophosphodiester phosphodiesterase family protein [Woodsholea maritima]|uniref:glycerophosphodiester phosphodiesterase family protein n=1 Tax=Woodsholea maritima TaxID=240237 RepID=UPI001461624A|nr:glycerophosphodiester phosphodiesterase family protein [Woodsholea maritima]
MAMGLALGAGVAASAQTGDGADLIARFAETDRGDVFVVAHRGCWSAAPENSVAAIEACARIGVRAVEIDVQMTRDGHLIVFHDSTLKRMTNGWGYIADHTLEELRALRLYERDGSPTQQYNRPFLTDMTISTLEDVLEAARGHVMINLEIKTNHGANFETTFNRAVEVAQAMDMADQVFWKIPPAVRGVSQTDIPADQKYQALKTEGLRFVTPIIWQAQRSFEDQIADFNDDRVHSFEIVAHDLDYWPLGADGRIEGADQYRYMIVGVLPRWGAGLSDEMAMADPDAIWGRMVDMGADLIMTDRPEQLVSYLQSRGLRP